MKAISGNRYILLHDETDEDSQINSSGVNERGVPTQDEASKDMVPESQPISVPMAT